MGTLTLPRASSLVNTFPPLPSVIYIPSKYISDNVRDMRPVIGRDVGHFQREGMLSNSPILRCSRRGLPAKKPQKHIIDGSGGARLCSIAENGVSPVDRRERLSRSTRHDVGPRPPRSCPLAYLLSVISHVCRISCAGPLLRRVPCPHRARILHRNSSLFTLVQERQQGKQHDVHPPEARLCGLPPQEAVCRGARRLRAAEEDVLQV